MPFGDETGAALDRYLRARRKHPLAFKPDLWLPASGPTFSYPGLASALGARARAAGVTGFSCHRLRHTGASLWLRSGRSPMALQAVGGWSNLNMVLRYTEDDAAAQAIEEHNRTDLKPLGRF